MTIATQGRLADKPLGELIRELGVTVASGALRLARDRAKAVIYFDKGALIFAASNIRAHRLSEFLKRAGIANDELLAQASPTASDEELFNLLERQNKIRPESRASIRANHVADILRTTLLWTEGEWQFDSRVRLAGETRVSIDARRLLLESTRHLPAAYIAARFPDPNEQIQPAPSNGNSAKLLPQEAFVASRLADAMTIAELQTVSGIAEDETLRSLYALAMAGAITRGAWAVPQETDETEGATSDTSGDQGAESVEDFVARISKESNYYDVLGIDKSAETTAIKTAYHALARRYHPDRFHQADSVLRPQIESAFARVARAYETLADVASRAAYDAQLGDTKPGTKNSGSSSSSAAQKGQAQNDARATASFQKGLAALKQNQLQQAVRFFAEAASIEPRCARYRAEYGRALTQDPKTRRIAEIELKAAISLDPGNATYKLLLAELYKALGLRRRAEGEVQRALMTDPNNEAARALLASLKK